MDSTPGALEITPARVDAARWITEVEFELCQICGYEGKEADRHTGRAKGPVMTMSEPGLGKNRSPTPHASPELGEGRRIGSDY